MNNYKPGQPFRLYRDDPNFVSKDTELADSLVREHIDIGGVVVYAYRYLGTPPQSRDFVNVRTDPGVAETIDIGSFLGIEDPMFLENRDRAYDLTDVPRLRGVFKVSQNDLVYGRFGPQGLNNDVFSIEFHTRTVEAQLARNPKERRRFVIGDVLEFPHLRDISVNGNVAPKLYEVARVMKSPTGWDPHYANHVLALILRPVRDQQEFIQFMERIDEYGKPLGDQVSTGPNIIKLNDAMTEKARELAPDGPWDVTEVYFDPKNQERRPDWWIDDGRAPNGIQTKSGVSFPVDPKTYDWYLRLDFVPNRLFQFFNGRWNIRQIDQHLEWQNYAWLKKYQDFLVRTDDSDPK